jgi:hypothetical protein
MNDDADRERLVAAAKALRDELIPRITGPIDFRYSIRTMEEDTDGWCVKLADVEDTRSEYNYDLEIWYDTFSTRDNRRFWYGFSAPGKRAINSLLKQCPDDLQPEVILDDSKIDQDAQISVLQNRLGSTLLRSLEKYDSSGYSYFGVYGDIEGVDVLRSTEFLQAVLLLLPDFDIDQLGDDYRRIENRRYVASHLRRERDPKLARLCKVRDDYRCRVCGCRFEDEYGVLGKDFAEAHHVIPLSQLLDPVMNSQDALITVCSNCHRMLHRLPGEAGMSIL